MENVIMKLKKEKSFSVRVAVYRNSDKKPLEQTFTVNSHEQMRAVVDFFVRSYTGNTASRGVGVYIDTEEKISASAGFAKSYNKSVYTYYNFFFWDGHLSNVRKRQTVWFSSDGWVKNEKWLYPLYRHSHKEVMNIDKQV